MWCILQWNLLSKSEYNQLLIASFGTDFYSRFLGAGRLPMGNLYSGFDLGSMWAMDKAKKSDNTYFVAPHLGLELLKWNMLIVDSKAAWLIPLSESMWDKTRGLQVTAGMNVIF